METDVPVLYRDMHCAVINKPSGLLAHASRLARGEDDFLLQRLHKQFGQKVFLIHRLDRATSGCVLVAFDAESAGTLGKVFMEREVKKDYLAVCRGWPEPGFTVDYPLDGGPGKPEKKPAITVFERLACAELALPSAQHESSRYALMLCTPETGRFRQIRRHLKHLSHHLIGDTSHGDGRHNRHFRMLGVHRMLLHAWKLHFPHPVTGDSIGVTAPLDAEFCKALQVLNIAQDLA